MLLAFTTLSGNVMTDTVLNTWPWTRPFLLKFKQNKQKKKRTGSIQPTGHSLPKPVLVSATTDFTSLY